MQKLESLGVLAGGIAHDFNNLLMVVLGHAEMALQEISPRSAVRGNLTEITTAAQRAADLCRQMLAYAGRAVFALERVELRELVEEMAHLLKTAISKKAILNLSLERGLPPIEADPSQIRQIVMNLVINASEAIGDRSGVITVSVGATRCDEEYLRKTELHDDLAPGLYVHLEVTDTGSGMDAETRSRIFEPFFTTKFTGRGLGLAAVLGIVRAHKGALKVYSEPGKGTTFKVLFPALEEKGRERGPSNSSPQADWRGQGTILLVDDEESLIDLGARMLEHLGFTRADRGGRPAGGGALPRAGERDRPGPDGPDDAAHGRCGGVRRNAPAEPGRPGRPRQRIQPRGRGVPLRGEGNRRGIAEAVHPRQAEGNARRAAAGTADGER